MSDRQMPTVTARFDRNPLNVKRAAVCHLVVEVTAPKAEQTSPQTQRPLNLGLVIDASGILIEARAGQERRSIFFIEGRTLVRLTISGPSANRQLQNYAAIALDKVSRQ